MNESARVINTPTSLWDSIRIQCRVIHALVMREIITRYGRHNIGYAWLFAEPMLFTGGIVALWSVFHAGATHSINIIAFALTGYPTILLWRNTIGRCTMAIEPNTALLYHRNVRAMDLFLARIVLEIAGVTLCAVIMLTVPIVAGWIAPPVDILTMVGAWGLVAWYSAAMALIVGGLSEYSELVERLWHPIAYFQLPISGALTMAAWLPDGMRDVLLLFPVPNAVELFRHGYFGDSVTTYYDVPYVVFVQLVLTWLGLWIVRDVSQRVEPS